ncbi:hypothetical protein QE152_g6749 [Popillia japonica]|uniref:Uncharacterized protein n=1 Tax=Popillia japonica TaxID=7064 RepID=A0AAW1MH69_POPJA
MKTEIKRLQERTEQLEKITKKKNLIVTGIKIENSDEKQLKGKMEKFLEEELKLKIKLREEWSWDEEGGKLQKPRTPKN